MRLRGIESKIEYTIYRIDRQAQTTPALIQGFLDQLNSWKRAIPAEYHDQVDSRSEPYNGIDIFVGILHAELCHPPTNTDHVDDLVLQMCPTPPLPPAVEAESKSSIPEDVRRGMCRSVRVLQATPSNTQSRLLAPFPTVTLPCRFV